MNDFAKRFGLGFLKGLSVGVVLGAVFQLVLGWTVTVDLLGFLIAMGVGATVGTFGGKPAWLAEAWLESVLKVVFGIATGALVFWLLGFVTAPFGHAWIGTADGPPWNLQPIFYAPIIAVVFGLIVELDNTKSSI